MFTVATVKNSNYVNHCAKFCRNRSNRGRDMAIFWFFQDSFRPLFWIYDACVGTTHEGHLVVFTTVQNLVGIDAVVLIICTFFYIVRQFGLKTLIHAPKLGVLRGFWSPKCGAMWTSHPKGISLRESASFEPSCVKIGRRVWPVREFPKKV